VSGTAQCQACLAANAGCKRAGVTGLLFPTGWAANTPLLTTRAEVAGDYSTASGLCISETSGCTYARPPLHTEHVPADLKRHGGAAEKVLALKATQSPISGRLSIK
jgi:hypothetical protein